MGRLVLTHKDRLLRFGAELVFAICEAKGVEVVILNRGEDTSFEEDLAQDVLEIITVFSARLYGSRSRKNQKLIDAASQGLQRMGRSEIRIVRAVDVRALQKDVDTFSAEQRRLDNEIQHANWTTELSLE